VADRPPFDTIAQIVGGQLRGAGNDHRPELDARKHGLPDRRLVRHHQQQPVAAPHPGVLQEVGDPVGSLRHLRIAEPTGAAVVLDDPQGRGRVGARLNIEEIQRPVELGQRRPTELATGGCVVFAVPLQKISRLDERVRHGNRSLLHGPAVPPIR